MITVEQTLAIHKELIELYGGTDGVRDQNGLESALIRPFDGFGELDYYPTTEEKAAAILQSVLLNHPFVDGNKRTGFYLMLAVLDIGGKTLEVEGQVRYDFVIQVASGKLPFEEIVTWIRNAVAPK